MIGDRDEHDYSKIQSLREGRVIMLYVHAANNIYFLREIKMQVWDLAGAISINSQVSTFQPSYIPFSS